jgi:RimJ/RimL family protein N-acetyltransferase
MEAVLTRDRAAIECALRRDVPLHLYGLGDLDDFYWPYTTWFASTTGGEIAEIALLYSGQELPVLLALSRNTAVMKDLIRSILHLLPAVFYAHLSPGVEATLSGTHGLEPHGGYLKMALRDTSAPASCDVRGTVELGPEDLEEVLDFYRRCYPGNWFDPRMLETRMYFGIREEGELVSISGVHVYSPEYGVAALGNIATDPAWRNRGFGRRVTARLCTELSGSVSHIGLNVRADNASAIACYRGLGFEEVAPYGEYMVRRRCP